MPYSKIPSIFDHVVRNSSTIESYYQLCGALAGKGFTGGKTSVLQLRQGLCMLFLLNRSPSLEAISGDLLAVASAESVNMRRVTRRITMGLQSLKLLPAQPKDVLPPPVHL